MSAPTTVSLFAPPRAEDDAVAVPLGGVVVFDPLANDILPGGDAEIVLDLSDMDGLRGAIAQTDDGRISYTATPDDFDNFDTAGEAVVTVSYSVESTTAFMNAADVGATIAITVTNAAPTAVDVAATGDEDGAVVRVATDDSDPESDAEALKVRIVSGPRRGTLTDNGDGALTYTPDRAAQTLAEGETALWDSFEFRLDDGTRQSEVATAEITLVGENDAPEAAGESVTLSTDAATIPSARLLENDSDPEDDALSIASLDATTARGAAVSLRADGVIALDYAGLGLASGETIADSFAYVVTDGAAESARATAALTVTAPTAIGGTEPDDPETGGSDVVRGSDASESIGTGGGRLDGVETGGGADVIAFGEELRNGAREAEVIFDFDPALDRVALPDWASVTFTAAGAQGRLVRFSGDGDTAFFFGVGPDADLLLTTGDALV